jgi:hypothetical protein
MPELANNCEETETATTADTMAAESEMRFIGTVPFVRVVDSAWLRSSCY